MHNLTSVLCTLRPQWLGCADEKLTCTEAAPSKVTHFITFPWQQQTLHTKGARGQKLKQGLSLPESAAEDGLGVPVYLFIFPLSSSFTFSALSLSARCHKRTLLLYAPHDNRHSTGFKPTSVSQNPPCSLVQRAPRAHMAPACLERHQPLGRCFIPGFKVSEAPQVNVSVI